MIELLAFFGLCFSSLFTIMNPFSTSSIFLTLAKSATPAQKRHIAKNAAITAACVLIVFSMAGNLILSFFSITIEAFRIAGGLLIIRIAFMMLTNADDERKHAHKPRNLQDLSLIPLAIPMLSGPGAMTATIVLMAQATGVLQMLTLISAIMAVCYVSFLILSNSSIVLKFIGKNGRKIIDQIMGLLVLVVGIQFIINGVLALI
ncbi:MAG: MarC family protein [Candidatus Woesearchaeota archaeon]